MFYGQAFLKETSAQGWEDQMKRLRQIRPKVDKAVAKPGSLLRQFRPLRWGGTACVRRM
jgi:hypothetical protein